MSSDNPALAKNLIRELAVWVHPGHKPISKDALERWKDLIEVFAHEPRLALIETSNSRGNEFYGKGMVGELEDLARRRLGPRFHLWRMGDFIDCHDREQLEHLKSILNIESRRISDNSGERLFFRVYAYGQEPDKCVLWQLRDFGLISTAVETRVWGLYPGPRHFSRIFDRERCRPPEGFPSTKESLRLMAGSGFFEGISPERVAYLGEKLPSSSDCIVCRGSWQVPGIIDR